MIKGQAIMNDCKKIIDGIIRSGGLYGEIASQLPVSHQTDFIVECFEQCHNKTVYDLWGGELIMDIISYRLDLIRNPLRELIESETTAVRQ